MSAAHAADSSQRDSVKGHVQREELDDFGVLVQSRVAQWSGAVLSQQSNSSASRFNRCTDLSLRERIDAQLRDKRANAGECAVLARDVQRSGLIL